MFSFATVTFKRPLYIQSTPSVAAHRSHKETACSRRRQKYIWAKVSWSLARLDGRRQKQARVHSSSHTHVMSQWSFANYLCSCTGSTGQKCTGGMHNPRSRSLTNVSAMLLHASINILLICITRSSLLHISTGRQAILSGARKKHALTIWHRILH